MKKLLIIISVSLLLITNTNNDALAITITKTNLQETEVNKYLWTTARVNFRTKDNLTSNIIKTLDNRTKVIFISEKNGWTKVKIDKQIGYVYSEYLRETELPSVDFTEEEIDMLAKIMWLEARSQSDKGLAGVCIVVINRILSTEFSDTMLEVLSDKNGSSYEFSTWKLIDTAKPDERIYRIIQEVRDGTWDDLLDEDYVYFSTSPRNNNGTVKIDDHYFCKY